MTCQLVGSLMDGRMVLEGVVENPELSRHRRRAECLSCLTGSLEWWNQGSVQNVLGGAFGRVHACSSLL